MLEASAAKDPVSGWADASPYLRMLGPQARWSLRAELADLPMLAQAWGAPIPDAPLSSASGPDRHALRLGPDEWLLIAESASAADGLARLTPAPPFSLVEVSARNVALEVSGDRAREVLAAGCPLDLAESQFPQGRATRTVFGKIEILLWRPGPELRFRLECWRSFAAYLRLRLTQAAADLDLNAGIAS